MIRTLLILLLPLLSLASFSQQAAMPVARAARTAHPPRVDGILDEACWELVPAATAFRQYKPVFDIPESFPTAVRILYDDHALYIAARMNDPRPDSILRQLGNRDEENLNADYLAIGLDTYNNQLDAYIFQVFASGIQRDYRVFDDTYDAVWESKVNIDEQGWTAEMKIPYSAIRFPATEIQPWRLQIHRYIRRYRETDIWSLEQKGVPNSLVYWGRLEGVTAINPAIRLSLTPFLSASWDHYPLDIPGQRDESFSFSGGLDLKYGLNESFTLDLTLLPDFSQVQSDNRVKNLTAFETIYEEQRPFFKEAVDLFNKGDLFYSRRIGRIPLQYFAVEGMLSPGEKIIHNPPAARLINATKVSGRNRNGLAIGVLNAVTADTYAEIEDEQGNSREVLTDPATNYNILVFDQAIKNNSSFYLINTSVIRDHRWDDANVTGSGISLFNRENTLKLSASGALSHRYRRNDSLTGQYDTDLGYKYNLSFGKVKGRFQANVYNNIMDNHFSANDMSVTLHNNIHNFGMSVSWNLFEPWKFMRDGSIRFNYDSENNYLTYKPSHEGFEVFGYTTLTNYLSLWGDFFVETEQGYNYYEPRKEGMFYIMPRYRGIEMNFSSDYRKTFALDGKILHYWSDREKLDYSILSLTPLVRVSDHLFFSYTASYSLIGNDIGFASFDPAGMPVFGLRKITEVVNTLDGRYMFRNNLSLSLRTRHYWSKGDYSAYFRLLNDGNLAVMPDGAPAPSPADYNFNAFNIDMVLWWEFAPGSRLNLIWKNAILKEDQYINLSFRKNVEQLWDAPQDNSITIKLLYYFDYLYLSKLNKKHKHT